MSDEKFTGVGVIKWRRRAALEVHHNRTGFRGVYWDNNRKKFVAEIGNRHKKTRRRLGRFPTARDAALAYDIAAIERYGEDAALNFPASYERQTQLGSKCKHVDGKVYFNTDGVRSYCTLCNIEAVIRYENRMIAQGYTRKRNRGPWIKPNEVAE